MGASQTSPALPSSKNYTILDYGYCKVWKRRDTQREAMEQYEVLIQNERQMEAYRQMWLVRTQQPSIVAVYYFTHKNNNSLCAMFESGTLLTERVAYRLSQFSHIPYCEVLLIIRRALGGYRLLNSQYGLFKVRSTMIGVCGEGEVKVWHHTDYSQALPQNANCATLNEMILSIVAAVEKNAQPPRQHPKFSQFMARHKTTVYPGYDETLKLLDSFMQRYQIPQRESLPRLGDYLRQVQGWEQYSYNSNFRSNLTRLATQSDSQAGERGSRHGSRGSDRSVTRKPSIERSHNANRNRSANKNEKIRLDQHNRERERNRRESGRNGSVIDHLKDSDSEDTVKNGRPGSIYTAHQINEMLGTQYSQRVQLTQNANSQGQGINMFANRNPTQSIQSNNPFSQALQSNRSRQPSQSSRRSTSNSRIEFRYSSPSKHGLVDIATNRTSIDTRVNPPTTCIYTNPSYSRPIDPASSQKVQIPLKSFSRISDNQETPNGFGIYSSKQSD